MMRALVLDQEGWKRHIMLDKETGLDPPGIKLRAAQGFDAADFFITGYWIWQATYGIYWVLKLTSA
jgi:phospholipid:diacylglycerol acyltransferase